MNVTPGTIRSWRIRTRVPAEYKPTLLKIITDRLRPDEQERQRVDQRLDEIVDKLGALERLDEILEKLGAVEEVRGLLQRYVGPLPGAEKPRQRGG